MFTSPEDIWLDIMAKMWCLSLVMIPFIMFHTITTTPHRLVGVSLYL